MKSKKGQGFLGFSELSIWIRLLIFALLAMIIIVGIAKTGFGNGLDAIDKAGGLW